jgi:xanthine dehydrogenase accessory factor
MVGSVSGGCVEGAVVEAGLETLSTGRPQLLSFGVADETAFEVIGLACGGQIEVFVEPLSLTLCRLLGARPGAADASCRRDDH